ncbi:MAG: hypothetical protein R2849_10575 [Thermomicrobiales bacterium]
MITLAIIIASVLLSLAIGLPIDPGRPERGSTRSAGPILDGMQTMPAFVYLLPAMFFFDSVPAVIATIVYAVPPLIRLTTLGIKGVSPSAVEAAESYERRAARFCATSRCRWPCRRSWLESTRRR